MSSDRGKEVFLGGRAGCVPLLDLDIGDALGLIKRSSDSTASSEYPRWRPRTNNYTSNIVLGKR